MSRTCVCPDGEEENMRLHITDIDFWHTPHRSQNLSTTIQISTGIFQLNFAFIRIYVRIISSNLSSIISHLTHHWHSRNNYDSQIYFFVSQYWKVAIPCTKHKNNFMTTLSARDNYQMNKLYLKTGENNMKRNWKAAMIGFELRTLGTQ